MAVVPGTGKLVKKDGSKKSAANAPPPPIIRPPEKLDFVSGGSGSDVTFTAVGLDDLATRLLSAPPAVRQACGYEMADVAAEIMRLSKDDYVPKDTMALFDSGMSDDYDPRMDTEVTQIAMWYAAPGSYKSVSNSFVTAVDARGNVLKTYRQTEGDGGMKLKRPEDYAWMQHEILTYDHHGIGGPKYLERPFQLMMPQVFNRIAAAYASAIGSVGGSRALGMDAGTFAGTFGKDLGI